MIEIEPYLAVGYAFELLARSAHHGQFTACAYMASDILPPLRRRQLRIYLSDDGLPVALISWARLSFEVEEEVLATARALRAHEWRCGPRLFINDFIAPDGMAMPVARDLERRVFADETASGIRRYADGSVRRFRHRRSRTRQPHV